jgi:hypothetical protein
MVALKHPTSKYSTHSDDRSKHKNKKTKRTDEDMVEFPSKKLCVDANEQAECTAEESKSIHEIEEISPLDHWKGILEARGYSIEFRSALTCGYYMKPTSLQLASHGIALARAINRSDSDLLRKLLSCGLSPNPCNAHGESAIHKVCRTAKANLLQTFIDYKCSVQISDDFGRTPFHDACWTSKPNFEVIELLLGIDNQLPFIIDCRSNPPLSYVTRNLWKPWNDFLDRVKDRYWPEQEGRVGGNPTKVEFSEPDPNRIRNPEKEISCELASLISNGKVDLKDIGSYRIENKRLE